MLFAVSGASGAVGCWAVLALVVSAGVVAALSMFGLGL